MDTVDSNPTANLPNNDDFQVDISAPANTAGHEEEPTICVAR